MRGYKKTDLGQIVIDPKVIMAYAAEAAYGTFGIIGMVTIDAKDGIVKLLKREAAGKGIKVTINNNKVTIDYHLMVKFGVNVLSVQANLVENLKYKVEQFAGLEVQKVNIYIEKIHYGKEVKGGII
ncbi:MAG: Asp23/Gls24 family envelope stress response protein [Lachnospiraceae bacterium]